MMRPRHAANGHQWRKARNKILQRDTHCHLCGQPINPDLPAGHPGSFEVDHIIPFAIAPHLEYDLDNLAGAHRICNARKGVGGKNATPPVLKTSQEW